MASSDNKDFIVAIELGSSKITGIAGTKKDGTWQIIAYAEVKSADSIRRGVIYNIETTYKCISNIKDKLEQVLKTNIERAYVGIGGQSMRSFKTIIKRSMVTHSYITAETIDSIRKESYNIPFADYEVLENIPQDYKVDGTVASDPVGVQGTNIEGEFLNIIAKQRISANVRTVFAKAGIEIAGALISPLQLADKVLNDAEKRSGCALVDLGADTTTLVVYKNNIVRYLVTIPLGSNNINKDLATLPIDETEIESVKLRFGDACAKDNEADAEEEKTYKSSAGPHPVDVATIKNYIEARMYEIITNVCAQLVNSSYNNSTLLSGLVLTGGGSNMKNIAEAFKKSTKIEKIRIAKKIEPMVMKTSSAPSFTNENGQNNTLISLLLSGTELCGGGKAYDNTNFYDKQKQEDEQKAREEQAKIEREKVAAFEAVKTSIREAHAKVIKMINELNTNGKSKAVRTNAHTMADTILDEVLGEKYNNAAKPLMNDSKYEQHLKQGEELIAELKNAVQQLKTNAEKADKDNSIFGRVTKVLNQFVEDKE